MSRTRENGFSPVETLLVLVIVGIIGFVGWYVYHAKNNTDKNLNSAATTSQNSLPASKEAVSTTTVPTITTPGTDDATLNSDLNSVNSSQTQAGQDSSSANSAVNDSQNQITVPTN